MTDAKKFTSEEITKAAATLEKESRNQKMEEIFRFWNFYSDRMKDLSAIVQNPDTEVSAEELEQFNRVYQGCFKNLELMAKHINELFS